MRTIVISFLMLDKFKLVSARHCSSYDLQLNLMEINNQKRTEFYLNETVTQFVGNSKGTFPVFLAHSLVWLQSEKVALATTKYFRKFQ